MHRSTKIYGKSFMDWEDYNNLNFNPNMLDEFLWYNHNKNIKFVFVGFDLTKIKQEKTYDDYEWNIIFKVVEDFIKKYPNNTMHIIDLKLD